MTLKTGDEVISINDVYGGTRRLFTKFFSGNFNVKFTFVDMANDLSKLKKLLNNKIKMVYIESPTNPCLTLADIKAIADLCK